MNPKIHYQFHTKIWQHQGTAGGSWQFASLPSDMSVEIRNLLQCQEEGWGRLKAKAQINQTTWDTSIWFDSKSKTYLLPLKAEIRKKEKLEIGMELEISIWV